MNRSSGHGFASILMLLFVGGLAIGALLVGLGAAAGQDAQTKETAEAASLSAAAAPVEQAPAEETPAEDAPAASDDGAMDDMAAPAAPADGPPAARSTPYGAEPLAHTLDGDVKVFTLTAAPTTWRTDDGTEHEAWAYNGQVPGPVIRGRVGERIRVEFANDLPEPTTIHWHGLNLPIGEDGVPGISQEPVAPGETHRYEFDLRAPGIFMYHPHYNTLAQQTKGLYGTFVVDPAEGPDPEVTEVFQVLSEMNGKFLINGKGFPSTDAYEVPRGKPVLVRTVNVGEMDHPMHLHGFLFRVVGADGGQVPVGAQYDRYTQNVAPGEAFDLKFTPNEVGTWLFHCHILGHVTGPNGIDAGMITTFKVV